jgi:hypothetical protein
VHAQGDTCASVGHAKRLLALNALVGSVIASRPHSP